MKSVKTQLINTMNVINNVENKTHAAHSNLKAGIFRAKKGG